MSKQHEPIDNVHKVVLEQPEAINRNVKGENVSFINKLLKETNILPDQLFCIASNIDQEPGSGILEENQEFNKGNKLHEENETGNMNEMEQIDFLESMMLGLFKQLKFTSCFYVLSPGTILLIPKLSATEEEKSSDVSRVQEKLQRRGLDSTSVVFGEIVEA